MNPILEQLRDIENRIHALQREVQASVRHPRPWCATHRHKRTSQLARELCRAIDMQNGRDLVVYEMLGTPGPLTRAESAIDFAHHYAVLGAGERKSGLPAGASPQRGAPPERPRAQEGGSA